MYLICVEVDFSRKYEIFLLTIILPYDTPNILISKDSVRIYVWYAAIVLSTEEHFPKTARLTEHLLIVSRKLDNFHIVAIKRF